MALRPLKPTLKATSKRLNKVTGERLKTVKEIARDLKKREDATKRRKAPT